MSMCNSTVCLELTNNTKVYGYLESADYDLSCVLNKCTIRSLQFEAGYTNETTENREVMIIPRSHIRHVELPSNFDIFSIMQGHMNKVNRDIMHNTRQMKAVPDHLKRRK